MRCRLTLASERIAHRVGSGIRSTARRSAHTSLISRGYLPVWSHVDRIAGHRVAGERRVEVEYPIARLMAVPPYFTVWKFRSLGIGGGYVPFGLSVPFARRLLCPSILLRIRSGEHSSEAERFEVAGHAEAWDERRRFLVT